MLNPRNTVQSKEIVPLPLPEADPPLVDEIKRKISFLCAVCWWILEKDSSFDRWVQV